MGPILRDGMVLWWGLVVRVGPILRDGMVLWWGLVVRVGLIIRDGSGTLGDWWSEWDR
jgi:hypothetical protein